MACGDDSGATRDASADAAGRDSGERDSGSDAGERDAGGDVGERDAGGRDAGGRDSGAGTDAGAACAFPAPFDEGATYARTLYVQAGSDGDGTEASPFGDIEDAAAVATPGTRVLVRAGTYDRVRSISPQGSAAEPIKFEAEGEVIIDGTDNTGWSMSDARYVVVEGFTIRDASVHGMNLDDGGSYDTPAEFVVLRDITIPSAGSGGNNDCIKMSGVDNFWILESDVAGCNRGEIVDMVGCHDGVIANSRFAAPVGNGVQAKGGSSDTLVTGNVFEDIPGRGVNAGGSTGLEFFRPIDAPHEAARIRVVANLFLRGGTESGAPIAFVGCDACEFLNNTVIEPQGWIARILQETTGDRFVPSREGRFANNLIVVNVDDLRTWFNVGGGTAPETFRFETNLWFALDRDDFTGPTYAGGIPDGVEDVVMDPQLVDRAGGDYRLSAGSPAAAAGSDVGALPPDLSGRCFQDPPAIGGYEAP